VSFTDAKEFVEAFRSLRFLDLECSSLKLLEWRSIGIYCSVGRSHSDEVK